ncbi:hypothetical protein [Deinococcus soli (ex Cha et al. 2016)]|uniref:Uncharacterized protein n=2 Tax=Deinococcus soli (ex Cha et al. 2016) TaxID=1309411 RepID=A0AAE3XKV8_9DEIO|nr:hypothetical protein [Deinococcus soli (ex Cha et al. 2016)]MDR6221458.1 hypothetical protein [Deinococcus soli (ex Cha et al. 2016)]MDR6331448.1 hypothetical protein [Deinococcus soli (ex Cha et al. 2016)]MDR6754601.1 hypothetical protein [Deinococcus soli (ex Cha et al. 2016)]
MSKASKIMDFSKFERELDDKYRSLSIIKGPFLYLLAQYHHTIHNLMTGSRRNEIQPNKAKASTLLSNLSYVFPIMIKEGTREALDENLDAITYLLSVDPKMEELEYATSYTNLFEVFPPFHRKKLKLLDSEADVFKLDYWSEDVKRSEYQDIVLGDVGVPITDSNYPVNPEVLYKFALGFPERVEFHDVLIELMNLAEHHYYNFLEFPMLNDEGMLAVAGVTNEEFRRFSAFWHSVSDFLIQAMVMLDELRVKEKRSQNDYFLMSQIADFCFFRLSENFFLDNLMSFTGLSEDQINALMRFYQIDIDKETPDTSHCADGYLPPFIKLRNQIIMAPHSVKLFLQARNMIYAVNKLDTKKFDNDISAHLEPELISQAQAILSALPGIEVVSNIQYDAGEIDMLAYSSSENLAIHFQAKGAIPPQGSRMTRSLEERVIEALRQLDVFKNLDQTEKDSIISHAFGRKVNDVEVIDAVLCRTYFGSEKAYLKRNDAIFVNLAMLVRACIDTRRPPIIHRVTNRLREMESKLVNLANPRSEFESLKFDNATLTYPVMKYDDRKLINYSKKTWESLLSKQPNILINWWRLRDISEIGLFATRQGVLRKTKSSPYNKK